MKWMTGAWLLAACHLGAAATVQESLQGLNPIGANCPKNIPTSISVTPAAKPADVPEVEADLSCAVTPAAAAALMKNGTFLLDTRDDAEYQRFHIDGSLNLDPSEIRTKSFLKGRSLVLTGKGKGDRALYEVCRQLKAQGYANVTVLRGGMTAWLNAGLPVVGEVPNTAALNQLSPEELSYELMFDRNIVITTLPLGDLKGDLKKSTIVGSAAPQSIKKAVEARKKAGALPVSSVIVVLGHAIDTKQAADIQKQLAPDPALFYIEPVKGYVDYIAARRAMWNAKERGPKTPKCSS